MKNLSLFTLGLFVLVSCKKTEEVTPINPSATPDCSLATLTYDPDSLDKKSNNILYNSDGKLIKFGSNEDYQSYEYSGSAVVQKFYLDGVLQGSADFTLGSNGYAINGVSDMGTYYTYQYNNEGFLIKAKQTNLGNNDSTIITFTYSGGNAVSYRIIRNYLSGSITHHDTSGCTMEYYTDKANTLGNTDRFLLGTNVLFAFPIQGKPNANLLKKQIGTPNAGSNNTYNYDFTYTYNSDGNPTLKTTTRTTVPQIGTPTTVPYLKTGYSYTCK